jgi:hypothetical protein
VIKAYADKDAAAQAEAQAAEAEACITNQPF